MNTHSKVMARTGSVLLLGLAWAGSAVAQQPAAGLPAPGVDRLSCTDVNWHPGLLNDYPSIAQACREVILVDGQKWARFEAEFEQVNRDGSFSSNFMADRGRSLGTVQLMPAENQRVELDGRPYRFSELQRGQVLNFYAPENLYAFSTSPGVSDAELVQPVAAQPAGEVIQLAQAEPATATRPTVLPATAGFLPLMGLGGLLALGAGFVLTLRRYIRHSAR